MPPFRQNIKLKNTEKFSKTIFSLPIYPDLRKKEQMKIIKYLKQILNENKF